MESCMTEEDWNKPRNVLAMQYWTVLFVVEHPRMRARKPLQPPLLQGQIVFEPGTAEPESVLVIYSVYKAIHTALLSGFIRR